MKDLLNYVENLFKKLYRILLFSKYFDLTISTAKRGCAWGGGGRYPNATKSFLDTRLLNPEYIYPSDLAASVHQIICSKVYNIL